MSTDNKECLKLAGAVQPSVFLIIIIIITVYNEELI